MAAHSRDQAMTVEVDVAIVGAGIGGVALGVALQRAGIEADVYERTEVLEEVGGSVVIREPGTSLLDRWGLGERFRACAVPVDHIAHWDAAGVSIGTSHTDMLGDGQAYSVDRTDLHHLLVDALPPERLHLGFTVIGARNEGEHAVVDFDGGRSVRARLVVGADGITSVIRPVVIDDELTFAHLVILRGLSPAAALPDGVANDRLNTWAHDDRLLMTLPLRGGDQVALDTVVPADEPPAELWDTRVPTSELGKNFSEFYPPLQELIAAGDDTVLASPVYERAPIHNWSTGRITLLGDAAHPMAPRQGQGANQAIQDAGALADALARKGLDAVAGTLAEYQALRAEPAAVTQKSSQADPELRAVNRDRA